MATVQISTDGSQGGSARRKSRTPLPLRAPNAGPVAGDNLSAPRRARPAPAGRGGVSDQRVAEEAPDLGGVEAGPVLRGATAAGESRQLWRRRRSQAVGVGALTSREKRRRGRVARMGWNPLMNSCFCCRREWPGCRS